MFPLCKQCYDKLFYKQIFRDICNLSVLYNFLKLEFQSLNCFSILPVSVHKPKGLLKTEAYGHAHVSLSSTALNVVRVSLLQTESWKKNGLLHFATLWKKRKKNQVLQVPWPFPSLVGVLIITVCHPFFYWGVIIFNYKNSLWEQQENHIILCIIQCSKMPFTSIFQS